MVLDKIENYKRYTNLSKRLGKAFEYIHENDFNNMESGKYVIDNDDIFALVQEYDTREKADCKLESHDKYIDIQYMLQGTELMGVTSFTNQVPIEKNEASDYAFYTPGDLSLIRVDAGKFTIFFPDDLHMPCIKFERIAKVKKVVIKVRV